MGAVNLYEIPGIVGQAVGALNKHYGEGLEGIEEATVSELMALHGVGKQSAECTYAFFHLPTYELWYNENIRPEYNRKTDFEVMRGVFGDRISTILQGNGLTEVDSIKDLRVDELEKLEATTVRYGVRAGKQEVRIKLSPREARIIYDYFHLTGYEFHSIPKKVAARQKNKPEYHLRFPEEVLNKVLGTILGEEVEDLRKTIESPNVFRKIVYFDRFVIHHNQTHEPDELTRKLPPILSDLIGLYNTEFDPRWIKENEFYRDREIEDIMNDPGYKSILKKMRVESELFIE